MKTKINTSSGIKIHCSHTELVDITSLVPNPRNPNKHPDSQIAILAKVIRHQGWRSPIVVSKLSGFIVKGHGRYEAAKLLQVEKIPVDFQDYENQATEWADLIADNRIAELSETDSQLLREIIGEIKDDIQDVELTGFSDAEIDSWLNEQMVLQGQEQGATPKDQLEDYENSTVRQIVLVMESDEFEDIMAKLDEIKSKHELQTNTEAALLAIREYAKSFSQKTED